ncbi:hypothetical protein MW887_005638 [Aspergillus wentii]|nr:hypothetical protein MW887_005638 [Aspergillus wentii]
MRRFLHTGSALMAALDVTVASASISVPASAPTGATFASGFDMKTSWGNLSPYKEAGSFNVSKGVPGGCELSQVHVLHRHAQRYPTGAPLDGVPMESFHDKFVNYTRSHPNEAVGKGPLAFLNDWEYFLGEELLLTTGAATEATSGADTWAKYGRTVYRASPGEASWNESMNVYPNGTARSKPVFRTTSQARILESARWWLSGFFGNTGANSSYDQYDLVIIPEVNPFNNTLAPGSACPGAHTDGDDSAEVFATKALSPALKRLSKFLPSDFNLTSSDVLGMITLCPYEYATLGSSAFCSLFTEQEWRDFEYITDVIFYGDYGFGSPSGRAQGIGYVLELAARLEAKLIYSSDTSINYTYDDNTAQFPLHQPLYMDMSHDDNIVSVIAALGMEYFNYGSQGLPGDLTKSPPRTFKLNEITPFGARFISEVWTCPSDTSFDNLGATLYKNPDLSSKKDTKDYIRFVLNNAPVPLKGVPGCDGAKNGFCAVPDFLKGVPDMKKEAEYQYACYGDYNSTGQVGDGYPEE